MLPLISLAAAAHTYTAKVGYLGAGGDVHPPMATTLADAEALCSSLANCSAFTFEGAASGQIAKVRAALTLRVQPRASERLSNPIVSLSLFSGVVQAARQWLVWRFRMGNLHPRLRPTTAHASEPLPQRIERPGKPPLVQRDAGRIHPRR